MDVEISFGLIMFLVATFEHAVALARGVEDTRTPEKPTVPATDMVRAHTYAAALNEILQELLNQFDMIRWSVNSTGVRMVVGAAASAASRLELETRRLLPVSPTRTEVRSLGGGWPAQWVVAIRAAQQPLEVIDGERPATPFQALDPIVETILAVYPFIGEGVLIFEAISGREIVTGRNLSVAERVVAGFAVILPYIVGYILKGARLAAALTVTRRSVTLALQDLRVYSLLGTGQRIPKAVEIAVGLRVLSEESFKDFVKLLADARTLALDSSRAARLNYYFVRLQDTARVAQWLKIIESELGSNIGGLRQLRGVTYKPGEQKALALLAQYSGDSVVALPERLPTEYPVATRYSPQTYPYSKVTYPDAVWRGDTLELKTLKTTDIDSALKEIRSGQNQSSTVMVSLLENSKLTRADIEAALPRLWANSKLVSLSKVVIIDGVGMAVHARPDAFTVPFMAGLLRIGSGDPKRLVRIVEALQAEPSETARQ